MINNDIIKSFIKTKIDSLKLETKKLESILNKTEDKEINENLPLSEI